MKFITKRYKWWKELQDHKHDKRYDRYKYQIEKLKDIHRGERCFIFATGPSINKTNVDLLENEAVIGLNTSFNTFKDHNIKFKYYVVSDRPNAWMNCYKDILAVDTILFIGGNAGEEYLNNIDKYEKYVKSKAVLPVRLKRTVRHGWNPDLTRGAPTCSSTVSAMALPIVYYLGFSEVYIIGLDCDFSKQHHFGGVVYKSAKNLKILKPERDPKHWKRDSKEFEIIYKKFKKDGRKVVNCTVGGRMEVFPRAKLEDII